MVIKLLILLIFLKYSLLKINCGDYKNCIECTSTLFSSDFIKCVWKDMQCIETFNILEYSKFNKLEWYKFFDLCKNDQLSIKLMDIYSNNIDRNNIQLPETIELKSYNNIYNPENFFCEWGGEFPNQLDISFNMKTFNTDKDNRFLITITFIDGKKIIQSSYEIENKDNKYFSKNILNFKFYYFSKNQKDDLPFQLEIDNYKRKFKVYLIFFYVSIVFCIILFIVLCFYLFFCIREKYRMRRNITTRFQMAQMVRNNLNGRDSNNPLNNNQNANHIDINELKPIKYEEKLNEFKINCTICIDGFKEGQDVIILSCGHLFHFGCVKGFINNNISKCPNCNTEIKQMDLNIKNINNKKE